MKYTKTKWKPIKISFVWKKEKKSVNVENVFPLDFSERK
jgi:hypothetical protein